MLEPAEIQAAMAFHDDYMVLGTRRERVRQLGNGVTPPAAEFLISAVVDSLRREGRRIERRSQAWTATQATSPVCRPGGPDWVTPVRFGCRGSGAG